MRRPPKHSQFKPGRSGNPKGRPKGSVNLRTRIARQLRQTAPVTRHGRQVKMLKADLIYPWFEKMGVKRQKAYLASRAKETLPEGTPIPKRERADVLEERVANPGRFSERRPTRRRSDTAYQLLQRRCQKQRKLVEMQRDRPLASRDLRPESAPLGQGSRASLLVDLPPDEMALLIELVVRLGIN